MWHTALFSVKDYFILWYKYSVSVSEKIQFYDVILEWNYQMGWEVINKLVFDIIFRIERDIRRYMFHGHTTLLLTWNINGSWCNLNFKNNYLDAMPNRIMAYRYFYCFGAFCGYRLSLDLSPIWRPFQWSIRDRAKTPSRLLKIQNQYRDYFIACICQIILVTVKIVISNINTIWRIWWRGYSFTNVFNHV